MTSEPDWFRVYRADDGVTMDNAEFLLLAMTPAQTFVNCFDHARGDHGTDVLSCVLCELEREKR